MGKTTAPALTDRKRERIRNETAPMGRRKREPDTTAYSGRIANRLRSLRQERGWSVEEMLDKLAQHGVAVKLGTYYSYESGLRQLPPDLYPVFATIFGKSVRTFLPDA